jgi:hypothetical protein
MIFFWQIHVLLQLCWAGVFGDNEPCCTRKSVIGRKCSFEKLTQFSLGNNVLESSANNTDGFVSRGISVSSISWICWFVKNEPFWSLKTKICRMYSFQKVTQLSQGNNMLNAAASNIDGFLRQRNTNISSPSWIGLFRGNRAYLNLGSHKRQELFHSNTNSLPTGKQSAKISWFYHTLFFSTRYICLFNFAE